MLEVSVKSADGQHTGFVKVHGFDKLTPRAARAALEIAGYYTGTASRQATDKSGENTHVIAYRVYEKSARKTVDEVF